MHLSHIANMWNHWQPVGKREIRDHPPFRDTRQPHGIRLDKRDSPSRQKFFEMTKAVQLFAQCDRHSAAAGQLTMTLEVVVPNRFFQPFEMEISSPAAEGKSVVLFDRPLLPQPAI